MGKFAREPRWNYRNSGAWINAALDTNPDQLAAVIEDGPPYESGRERREYLNSIPFDHRHCAQGNRFLRFTGGFEADKSYRISQMKRIEREVDGRQLYGASH